MPAWYILMLLFMFALAGWVSFEESKRRNQEARDRQHSERRSQVLERKTARLQRLQRARQS
jgi:hypothetical protein